MIVLKVVAIVLLSIAVLLFGVYILLFSDKWRKRQSPPFDPEYEKIRAKNYPPPFPNGWFNLCSSDSLKKGEVKEIDAFGQKLAVFRGEDGKVGVVDVYCPHLNANLAYGKVEGNNLVCPFHAWNFNTQGECVHIPYCEKVPQNEKTNAKAWIVEENWGLILVWYHHDGEAPTWSTMGYLDQLKGYKYYGNTVENLRIHLQDFSENGADYAHFGVVHNLLTIPFAKNFLYIKHTTNITFGEGDEGHLAYFTDNAEIARIKDDSVVEDAGGKAKVTYYGPGFLVFEFNTRLGNPIIVKTFTPIGELKVRMEDHVYAPKSAFSLAVKYIVGEASLQFHDDINIWEKKNFAKQPMLVKGDGPIMDMRKWYSQFYLPSSFTDRGIAFNHANGTEKVLVREVVE